MSKRYHRYPSTPVIQPIGQLWNHRRSHDGHDGWVQIFFYDRQVLRSRETLHRRLGTWWNIVGSKAWYVGGMLCMLGGYWRIQFLMMFRTFYDLRLGHSIFWEKKRAFLAHGTNTDAHRKICDCCDVRIAPWMWICPIMGLHNLQTWCIICKCTDIFICRDNMENQWLLYFPDCWNSLLSK